MSDSISSAPVEYRSIDRFPVHRFGSDGSVWSRAGNGRNPSVSPWKRLRPSRHKNGHYRFGIYVNGERHQVSLHELVCEAWRGPRPPGTECFFADSDKENLRESNLSWGVASDNMFDPEVEYRELGKCDGYLFGDDGSVWTCWRTNAVEKSDVWRKLKPFVSESGHLQTNIKIAGKVKNVGVHALICEAFHGPCPEGMECCHGPDPDPANNVPSNLRWDTSLENNRDQIRHGTKAKWERNGSAKLTQEQVKWAIENRHLGPRKLGRQLGVAHATIGRILRGEGWKGVA
jgi:hypothetical protein